MKTFKNFLSVSLRIIISALLLLFLFKQVDSKSLLGIIKNANIPLLAMAFLITFFNYVLCLFRWEMLLDAAKINLQFKRVLISFAGGVFFNLFLPTSMGGDLVRSIDLSLHTNRPREVVATVLLDRLSGYIALVLVALAAVLLGLRFIEVEDRKSIFLSVGILALVLIIVLVVLFNRFIYSKINQLLHSPRAGKIRESIKNLHREIHIFRNQRNVALYNLIFSLVIQILQPVGVFLIALALGAKINILYFFIFIPIITAITFLPISIGGLGIRDLSSVLYFTKVGMGKDTAFSMSLLLSSFIFICGIIGGLIYVFTVHHRRKQYHKSRQVSPQP